MRSPVPEGSAVLQSGKPEKGAQASGRPCRAGKLARTLFALLLVASMAVPLAGCKDTDVLTQLVIDQDSEEVDYTLPATRLETSDGESDHVTMDEQRKDDDKEDSFEPDKPDDPTYDKQDPTTESTTPEANPAKTSDNSTAPTSDANSTANVSNGPEGAGEGEGESGSGDPDDATGAGSGADDEGEGGGGDSEGQRGSRIVVAPAEPGDSASEGDAQNDDANDEARQDDPSGYTDPNGGGQGNGGTGQVYGNDGTYAQLPNNTKGIAATGQMATIVQMLGGQGALRATSEQWLSDMQAKGAFPGELSDVKVGWSGDGGTSDTIDVDAIIDSGATVVLTSAVDGGLFNDQADADRLMEAGVSVVVMPPVGVNNVPDDDIVQSVRIVGELLKNAGGSIQLDSQAMAGEWVRQHDSVLNSVVTANNGYAQQWTWGSGKGIRFQGGSWTSGQPETWIDTKTPMFTCYIDGWATANVATYNPADYGASASVTYIVSGGSGYTTALRDVTSSGFDVIDYYMQHAGVMDTASVYRSSGSNGNFLAGSVGSTMFDWPSYRRGLGAANAMNLSAGSVDYLFKMSYGSSSGPAILGDDTFPALVARSPEIASNIKSSAEDQCASPYNPIWDGSGYSGNENAYSGRYPHFLDSYQVAVLPEGISGSWADGTPESFLVAPWTWDVFKRGGDMSDCDSAVNTYYETFYRTGGAALQNYGVVESVTTNKGVDY